MVKLNIDKLINAKTNMTSFELSELINKIFRGTLKFLGMVTRLKRLVVRDWGV